MASRDIDIATKERDALVEKLKGIVSGGKRIVIVGWKDSNHNRLTRRLDESSTVEFVFESLSEFGSNVGMVICTRFTDHSRFNQLKRKREVHPVVLSIGEIKRTLSLCEETFLKVAVRNQEKKKITHYDLTLPVAQPQILESANHYTTEVTTLTAAPPIEKLPGSPDMELFKKMFLERGELEGGMVGKVTLGRIRQACGLQNKSNGSLVKMGYIISVKSEGCKNAGRYRAGEKMNAVTTPAPQQVVSDPLVKAKMLIATEEAVAKEIADLEKRLMDREEELRKIDQAKDLIRRIEEMFED